MNWADWLRNGIGKILPVLGRRLSGDTAPGVGVSVPLESGYKNPMQVDDFKLTEHFTFYQFTRTDYGELQAQNRLAANNPTVIQTLISLAILMESVSLILGEPVIDVHSAYRCPLLNQKVGSSLRSQHLIGQAVDFTVRGLQLSFVFRQLQNAARGGKLPFGQLIFEKAERSYGVTEWMHLSLGAPWRDPLRCGQVLTMNDGVYELIAKI